MQTLISACAVDWWHLHYPEGLGKAQRALELAGRIGDLHGEVSAHYWATLAFRNMGDIEGARVHAGAMLEPAARIRDRFLLASSMLSNESICRLEGNWPAARDFSDQGLTVSPMDPRLLTSRVLIECQVGDFTEAARHLDLFLQVVRQTPPVAVPT